MPLPREETTPPVMKTNRVMGGPDTARARRVETPTPAALSWSGTAGGARRGAAARRGRAGAGVAGVVAGGAPAARPRRPAGGGGLSRMRAPDARRCRGSAAPAPATARRTTVARIAVVRVSRLAVPRPVMKPPMPCEVPMPRPPPSLRWISTTPISARVTNRWMISRTVVMARGFYAAAHRRLGSAPSGLLERRRAAIARKSAGDQARAADQRAAHLRQRQQRRRRCRA